MLAATSLSWAGRIVTDSIESKVLGATVKYNVYLPAGFEKSEARYPVVYLLHGFTDDYTAWERKGGMREITDELIASGEALPMVIIMPNAGGPDTENTWNGYFNMPGWAYEDFFFTELLPQAEAKYRCIGDKKHRAVMGLSMGGGGSIIYCQRHPDMFSSCYGMSPWAHSGDGRLGPKGEKTKTYYVQESVKELSAINFMDNCTDMQKEQLRSLHWFLDCGDDDFLLYDTFELFKKMHSSRLNVELRVRNGGHTWEYWRAALRISLPFASRNFTK